jgi:hypothetical protein
MQEATQSALTTAGLSIDDQTMTAMNPCNFASEEEGEQSLQLKDNILVDVATRASAFLNADELSKWQEFRTNAIKNSRNFILMERKLMAPVSQRQTVARRHGLV